MKRLCATLIYLTILWGIYFVLVYAIGGFLDYLFYADNRYGFTVYYYNGIGSWPDKLYMVTAALTFILPVIYYRVIKTQYHIHTIAAKEYFVQLVLYLLLNVVYSFVSMTVVYILTSPHPHHSYAPDWSGVAEILFGIISSLSFFVISIGKVIWDRLGRKKNT